MARGYCTGESNISAKSYHLMVRPFVDFFGVVISRRGDRDVAKAPGNPRVGHLSGEAGDEVAKKVFVDWGRCIEFAFPNFQKQARNWTPGFKF